MPSDPKFPAATHVEEYLMEIEPAMSRMFELLITVMTGVDIRDIRRESRSIELEKLNLAMMRNDSADVNEWIESKAKAINEMLAELSLERLQSGAEAKSLAAGSVAAVSFLWPTTRSRLASGTVCRWKGASST